MGDDGLHYVLEVDSKEKGSEDLIGKLDQMEKHLAKIAEHSSKAGHAHDEHAKHAKGLAGAFQHLIHSGMEPFLHKAKEVAEFEFLRRFADKVIEAPAEMIEKIKELGEEMLLTAAKAERTNTSFELLFGEEPGHEVLEYIEDIAKATEFTGERMKAAAIEMAKVGFAGQGLKRALAASIDIAALSPNKEEGLSAALTALERVKASGRVDARTLLRFGLGPEEFFKELSARTGEGVETLKKQVAKGKVDSTQALETLYTLIGRKTGKDLGGAGLKTGEGLEAKLTHLAELPELYFEKLAESPGLESFKEVLGTVLDELDPTSPKGQLIFAALNRAFEAVGEAIKGVDIGQLAENIQAAMVAIADSVKPVIELFHALGSAVDVLTKVSDAFTNPFEKEAMKVADQQEFRDTHKVDYAVDARLKEMLRQKRAAAARGELDLGPAEDPRKLRDRLYAEERGRLVGKASAEGQIKGMEMGVPNVEHGGHKLGDAAITGADKALDRHSPSRVFKDLGVDTARGFVAGVEGSTDMIDDVMAGAFAVPAPQGGRTPLGGGGPPMVINVGDIQINAPHATNAQEIAQDAKPAFRQMFLEVVEEMRAEMGT